MRESPPLNTVLLALLTLMAGVAFMVWVLPNIPNPLTDAAPPEYQSPFNWCDEAIRNTWHWQRAFKYCLSDTETGAVTECIKVLGANNSVHGCSNQTYEDCMSQCLKDVQEFHSLPSAPAD